jgi:hypothetical protein
LLFKRGMSQRGISQWGCALVFVLLSCQGAADPVVQAAPDDAGGPAAPATDDTFAVVGGEKISMEEYQANLRVSYRQRFFHGTIPDDELKAFRRDVADTLIDNVMLRQEAQRRGLKPEADWVRGKVEEYEKKYEDSAEWKQHRDQALAGLREKFTELSLLSQLERQVKDIPAPDPAAVRDYYQRHPDQFTTPEALRVSMIMLTVDPSSPSGAWRDAFDKAVDLVKRIRGGEDFEQLAYANSGDNSAQKGGDLGFIHKGMLSKDAQQVIDKLIVGAVSDPVQLLRGIAIFRLDERKPPVLNDFGNVRDRARKLLIRERADQAWQGLRDELRKTTPFTVNDTVL